MQHILTPPPDRLHATRFAAVAHEGGQMAYKTPKPIALAISLIVHPEERKKRLGTMTAHPLHTDANGVTTFSGVVLDEAGRNIGQISFNGHGFARRVLPRGRPRADDKRLAILLTWATEYALRGGGASASDIATADAFDEALGKTDIREVRRARKNYGFTKGQDSDAWMIHVKLDDVDGFSYQIPVSLLISSPAISAGPRDGLTIKGKGALLERGTKQPRHGVFDMTIPDCPGASVFKNSTGPLIVTVSARGVKNPF